MNVIEFQYQGRRFALPLANVRRVLHAAAPEPLPSAPDIVLGVLVVGGEPVTVVDFGSRLGMPPRAISAAHRLLVVEMWGFLVALAVDVVEGVSEREVIDGVPEQLAAGEFVAGLLRLEDGLCLIIDPERFLLDSECKEIDAALKKSPHASC